VTDKSIILPPSSGNGLEAAYQLTVMVPKRRYLAYLRERWWVIALGLSLAIGAMLGYETLRTETYTSFAQLYLSGDVQLNTGMLFTEDSLNYYGTQIELLKSVRLQDAAFDRAGLSVKPGKKNPYKVDVFQPLKTSILAVVVTGPEPISVQNLLQALVAEYLNYKKDTRRSTSEDLLNSLTSELSKRETELKAEQERWADFQKSNNVAVLEEEGKSAGLYLADLNLQLDKLRLEKDLLERGIIAPFLQGDTNLLPNFSSSTNSSAQSGTAQLGLNNDVALKSARVELAVLQAEMVRKTNELSHLNPVIRRLDDEITRLQKTVAVLEDQDLMQKRLELEEVKKRVAAIKDSLPNVESKVLGINEKLSEGQRFRNNIQREQGFYDHLLVTLQGVDLGKNVQQERISVLQPATPARLTERYLPVRVALAAMAGLFVSLGLVFIWYLLDDRFVSVRDIKDQFGEMVLGLVPQIRVPRSNPRRVLLDAIDSRRAYVECYRHLRSALLLASLGESRPQTILFTGATPAEGKTSIAVNLARVLAQSGLKVILADMDCHAGGVHQLLGGKAQPGVLEYLRGEASAIEILQQTEIPGLKLAPAGSHHDHLDGLFLRSQLDELIREFRKDHDFVILDGAPILAADDAALLVPHADLVVLVARPFYTKSRLVRQTLDMLYQRRAKQVAIVLNRARKDDVAGHYYERNGKSRINVQSRQFAA